MQIFGLVLMSIAILQYGIIPIFADFNRSHATNPYWTSHARFHLVWQVFTTTSLAIVALWFLWSPDVERSFGICIAAILSSCIIGSFFLSALVRKWYGGALSDVKGGLAKIGNIDLNLINFSLATALLVIGRIILLGSF